jgi:hypothetical protein
MCNICIVLSCIAAFSWFSLSEYVIAYGNMAYHMSAYYEFQDKSLVFCDLIPLSTDSNSNSTVSNGTLCNGTEDAHPGQHTAKKDN